MQATFTVTVQDFLRTVSNAALFAGTDETLPVLNAVRLEISEPDQNAEVTLTAVATDRYSIGMDTCKAVGVTAAAPLLIRLQDVKSLVKACKNVPTRSRPSTFVVAWVEDDSRVRFDIAYDNSVTVRQQDGEFPKYRSLIPDQSAYDAADGVHRVGLNPVYLARFALVDGGTGKSRPTMVMDWMTATKPAKVQLGDTFTGLIMPVRLSG